MTQEDIVKYTDHLLAEFYKGCQKQFNKENRQVDIVLSNGDFSTLQNIMCEAIINVQNQILDKACKVLKNTIVDDVFANRGSVIKYMSANEFGEWVPAMDSYIGVEGLQEETHVGKSGDTYTLRGRKFIGEYM